MKQPLTPKQEKFAQKYIELGNASEAYRQAYDAENMKMEVIHVKACELLADGKVSVRVKELQRLHQERHQVTVDSITTELEQARMLAMTSATGASAAVSASMGKAKLHGLIVDKGEIGGMGGGPIKTEATVTLTPDEAYKRMLDGLR